MYEPERAQNQALTRPGGAGLPAVEYPANDWQAMGMAFEGLCKAGLALTVGFSVAAAFCKMMDAGKVDVSSVVSRMAGVAFTPPQEKEPDQPR